MKLRGGVRVCGDAVLLDVWCVLRKFLFEVAVLRFQKTKQFAVFRNFRDNFNAVCGFLLPFFALFIFNLCDFAVFVSPLAPSVKVELN